MLSGAAKYQIVVAATHKIVFECAWFQFSMRDSIMGFRRYRAQAEKKG
jgi:hypothetical protein